MSTRRRFIRAVGAALLLASCPLGGASGEADPAWAAGYIRRVGDELAAIVANASSADARRQRLQPFIDRVVDVDGVARFCLGRFWRKATPAQQQEYVRLFHAVLMNAVLSRVGNYEHNEVRVNIDRPEVRDGAVHVATVVERSGSPPARVTWVVSEAADNPRILDVVAEGTSLRLTVRNDYSSYLSRHGESVDALIDALRQQACDGCAPSNRLGGQ
jgi:phospholipid transport system substrate-binding protein